MSGVNRDEIAVVLPPPPPGFGVSQYLSLVSAASGVDFLPASTSGKFNISSDPTPRDILNITDRIGTDGVYLCPAKALLYSASKHHVFSKVYGFQFNRTYSPTGYTTEYCDPPKTAERPNGDPNQEYFKCHAGEQRIVFGNVRRESPDRDGRDVGFMQLVVDYWSTFARNGDPNPNQKYLAARGYWQTLQQIEKAGTWESFDYRRPTWRILQWDGKQMELPEREQCDFLDIPLNYYETH